MLMPKQRATNDPKGQPQAQDDRQQPPGVKDAQAVAKNDSGTAAAKGDADIVGPEDRSKGHTDIVGRARKAVSSLSTATRALAGEDPLRDWIPRYCDELAVTGQITRSAVTAGVSIRTVARRRIADPVFRAEEKAAAMEAVAVFESEAIRRAVEGVKTEHYNSRGELLMVKTEYSDGILLRLLEMKETGSWRQKQQIEHSAPGIFGTRAERKAALEKVRLEAQESERRSLSGTTPLSSPSEKQVAGSDVTEMDA